MIDDTEFSIYCVHLPDDTERYEHMKQQFESVNINNSDVQYTHAARPFNKYQSTNYQFAGEFGVTLSQLKVLISSIEMNKTSMIFEDDIVFCPNASQRISSFIEHLPGDWAIAYLGGCPKEKLVRVNEHVCKVSAFTQAAGWLVNPIHVRSLTNFILDRMGLPFPHACVDNMINDYIRVMEQPGYCAYPPIIEQKDGWSTLRHGDRNYKAMIRDEWEKFKP